MKLMRLRTEQDGAALLELALMMPVFLLVVFGILQVALTLFAFCNLSYASHVGARYASLHGGTSSTPATSASVAAMMKPYLWSTGGKVAPVETTWRPSNSPGSTVQVEVQEELPLAIPFSTTTGFTVHSTVVRVIVR